MKLRRGDTIVLKGGTGTKRKFNGEQAKVSAYPKKGGWMAVKVKEQKIKWRKRGYASRLLLLKDDLMVHIFSFLGSKDAPPLQWVKDAAKVHTTLALVCSSWRDLCIRRLPSILGLLDANLDAIPLECVIPCILWLCKYKVALGVLKFDAELADLPLVVKLLKSCDTTQLKTVQAYVAKSGENTPSQWRIKAFEAKFSRETIDLTNDEFLPLSYESMARALNIPLSGQTSQKKFHDLIAAQCPRITNLVVSVSMKITSDYCNEYLSSTLFSKASISDLKLSINCAEMAMDNNRARFDWPVDGMIITKIVKNLRGLRTLALGASRALHNRRFHITSPTLRVLDVTGLAKGIWISCECPQLELYRCNGGPYGNGARPLFSADQLNNMQPFEEQWTTGSPGLGSQTLRVPAGVITFTPDLDVPDDCECLLEDYREPEAWLLASINDARFMTW